MSLPRIAIVGRPNVGKSSLLNMMAGAKVSIVDPTPGVTRDRVTSIVELTGPEGNEPTRLVEVTDTGGYGVYTAEGGRFDDAGEDLRALTGQIEGQIGAAVERADLILFVIDAQAGVTALDQTIAKMLRERALGAKGRSIDVRVVANKVDADKWEAYAFDGAALGFGEPLIVSAKTNFRRRDFVERLFAIVPETSKADRAGAAPEMRVALVGRRNAGKSSMVNALAGEERCIVSEIAGTTRDAIDVRFEMDGRACVAIDTAGVRKRTKFADAVEHWAFHRCLLSIERADVVLLLIDATQEITGIDKRLGQRILAEHKPCVIVVTKWDLVEGRKNRKGEIVTVEDYSKYIEDELKGMTFCPIVFTSSVSRRGLQQMINVAFELFGQAQTRVPTAKLNDVVRGILQRRGPTSKLGTRAKILYVSQVSVAPPTIVMIVNHPELFTPGYERYMLNQLHEELPFSEVPVRLLIRERSRLGLGELASQRRHGGMEDEGEERVIPAFDPPAGRPELEPEGFIEDGADDEPETELDEVFEAGFYDDEPDEGDDELMLDDDGRAPAPAAADKGQKREGGAKVSRRAAAAEKGGRKPGKHKGKGGKKRK